MPTTQQDAFSPVLCLIVIACGAICVAMTGLACFTAP